MKNVACCSVCLNPITSPYDCWACADGKAEMRAEEAEQAQHPDPHGFLGTFGPTQSERALDEGWEFDDEEEIPF